MALNAELVRRLSAISDLISGKAAIDIDADAVIAAEAPAYSVSPQPMSATKRAAYASKMAGYRAAQPGAQAGAAVAKFATGTKGELQQYARAQLAKFGWSEAEMAPLIDLWNRESGWRPDAQNPTSTAYGIAQFLNSTWAGTGIKKTANGQQQIDAGLIYIRNRYGSPSKALAFWNKKRWY